MKFEPRYTIIPILFILALTMPVYAQGETTTQIPVIEAPTDELLSIPPGHILYDAKILVQDIQEVATLDPTKKALLKQKHLNERIKELEKDAIETNSRHASKIIKKLQTKRIELEESLENLKPKCADVETGDIAPCKDFEGDSPRKRIYDAINRQNTVVLTRLVESTTMPEQSKMGITNALTKSGIKLEPKTVKTQGGEIVTANMTQSFRSSAVSYIPFKTAMIYVKGTDTWYSIVAGADSILISDETTLVSPDFYIYPSESQMNELMSIAKNVNNRKKLSWQDTIKLVNLWIDIPKKAGN